MSRLTQREHGRPASHDMCDRRQNLHASATFDLRAFLGPGGLDESEPDAAGVGGGSADEDATGGEGESELFMLAGSSGGRNASASAGCGSCAAWALAD